jgi:hypothetical protein
MLWKALLQSWKDPRHKVILRKTRTSDLHAPGHWAPLPVNAKKCKFLVLFATDTETSDLEIRDLPEEVRIANVFRA